MERSERKWGDTTSKRGEISRVFVGNTDFKWTCPDFEKKFSKYGKIGGIDINKYGFAFIQYEKVEDSRRAVEEENGSMMMGRKLEVRMFDKSGHPKNKAGQPIAGGGGSMRGRSRSPPPHVRENGYESRWDRAPPNQPFHGGDNRDPRGSGGGRYSSNHGHPDGYGPSQNNNNNYGPHSQQGGGGGDHYRGQGGPGYGHPNHQQRDPHQNHQARGGPGLDGPPPPPPEGQIVVLGRVPAPFVNMIHGRMRGESGIKMVDILDQQPQNLHLTLTDLFDRGSLFAVIVDEGNEREGICTLHLLPKQLEYKNISIDKAILMMGDEYMGRNRPPIGPGNGMNHNQMGSRPDDQITGYNMGDRPMRPNDRPMSAQNAPVPSGLGVNLPEEISFLLKMVMRDNNVDFMSLQQLDSIIDFFSREREKLRNRSQPQVGSGGGGGIGVRGSGMGGAGLSTPDQHSNGHSSGFLEHDKLQLAQEALNNLSNLGIFNPNSDSGQNLGSGNHQGGSYQDNRPGYGQNDRYPPYEQNNRGAGMDQGMRPGQFDRGFSQNRGYGPPTTSY